MTERINSFANKFANGILGSALVFFLAIFLYAAFHIISRDWYPPSLGVYYAVFAAVGILLCAFAFKFREDYKINFALLIFSGLVGVYLVECFLFIVVSINPPNNELAEIKERAEIAGRFGVSFDTRTPLQVVADLIEQGIDAYPAIFPVIFIDSNGIKMNDIHIYPLSGVSGKTTVLCNESGKYAIYESDEHGFNNPYGVFAHHDIDIMLVGDSFTHGECMQPGEDIGSLLRNTGKRVINLGMGGNGPLLDLAALKEYAEPMKPKVVLWMYYENDLEDLTRDHRSPLLLRYVNEDFRQRLMYRQPEINQILRDYVEKTMKQKNEEETAMRKYNHGIPVLELVKLWHLRSALGIVPRSSPPFSLFAQVIKKAKDMTSSWGGMLYFVYLPSWERYSKNVHHEKFKYRAQVLATVQSLNIPIIDIHDVVVNHDDPLSLFPFRERGHYTKEGYGLIAKKIATYLEYTSVNE